MEQSLSPSGSVDSKDMHGLLESNALDSPSPSVIDKEENMVESSAEKVDTVPRFIQLAKELQRSIPVAWNQHGSITEFDKKQYNLENPQIQKIMECQDPQSSLKALFTVLQTRISSFRFTLQMKCIKILLEAEEKANAVDRGEK
ncbi:PREDICTED: uncharacterized protein LOC104761009 isoform X1 [Camelina sativa]|uniref:Uncharacterized protein LOC104761009 isoform X1 n=1 Tax=Camelina sativa TaxID=90675 RepID=A0ABM0X8M7_CAMSA|nr:PREDICTED: uncharacterized protein LOC104761009 isoform X1 [Camelina sativa]